MARRQSSTSRSSSSSRRRTGSAGGSSRSASSRSGGRGSRPRSDGKIDISCPQCAAAYRVTEDMLDEKIECSECHRVFFIKATVGKRVAAPDHTKVYIGFGVAIVAIIGLFMLSSGGNDKPIKKKKVPVVEIAPFGRGDHPRALGLANWAQSLSGNNQLVLSRHTDMAAISKQLELESTEPADVMAALQSHKSTELLRTMDCSSSMLDTDEDMTAASGSGLIYVTPKSGDARFKRNTNGIFAVTFTADGDTVKVTSFKMTREPVWAPGKRPSITRFTPNEDIARPTEIEITDSGGTRKVQESEPAAVPHWKDASPELRTMVDQVVADIIRSADDSLPGGIFNRATFKIRSTEEKQAAVPRVLNAMFERYGDVNANNMEISLLNRALVGWTGFAVNYQVRSGTSVAQDKKERESSIRQWFAFWWRNHNDLSEWFDTRDSLEEEEDDGGK